MSEAHRQVRTKLSSAKVSKSETENFFTNAI